MTSKKASASALELLTEQLSLFRLLGAKLARRTTLRSRW
jgi:hypothetical protein